MVASATSSGSSGGASSGFESTTAGMVGVAVLSMTVPALYEVECSVTHSDTSYPPWVGWQAQTGLQQWGLQWCDRWQPPRRNHRPASADDADTVTRLAIAETISKFFTCGYLAEIRGHRS